MVSPAFPGFFFSFAGMTLLIFASVSAPVWSKSSFLDATVGGTTTTFGMLGECVSGGSCTYRSLGYNLAVNGASNLDINSTVLHNLTYTLIIHAIAGFLALVALLFGLIGVCAASRVCTILMAFMNAFAAFLALVIFVIDMVLWNIVKNRIIDAGYSAMLGNANWFTLGAVVALFIAFCTSVCGACGRFASGRMAGEKY